MDRQVVEYRPIPGFPGYRAGSDGTFWTLWTQEKGRNKGRGHGWIIGDKWRMLKERRGGKGYNIVALSRDRKTHHFRGSRLILSIFKGPCPPGMECCHEDGNLANDAVDNLEWGTRKKNMRDQYRHGTRVIGTRVHTAALTESAVSEIRKRYASGEWSYMQLAESFSVGKSTIKAAVTGKSWSHISGAMRPGRAVGEKVPLSKLTEVSVIAIRQEYVVSNVNLVSVARKYGVSAQTIRNVVTRKTWKHVE